MDEATRTAKFIDEVAGRYGNQEPQSTLRVRKASEVRPRPVDWLWPNRIAKGKLTMVGGDPGLGKSQITASIAAIISAGKNWPGCGSKATLGNAFILSAEDDAEDTIRPRLEAAGADLERCFIIESSVSEICIDGTSEQRSLSLASDLGLLEQSIRQAGGADVVVIDPITAYMGKTDSHKNSDVRSVLAPMGDLAADLGCAIVCVNHLNKAAGGQALTRMMGSLAFTAAARAAFLIAKDPEDDSRRLFLPAKNNIGNDSDGLAYSIESCEIPSQFGIISTSRIQWKEDVVTAKADDVLGPRIDPEERSALDEAKEFLQDALAHQSMLSRDVFREGKNAGHTERTLRKAKTALGIVAQKGGMTEGWLWMFPPKMTLSPEDAPSNSEVIFGEEGHLREPSGLNGRLRTSDEGRI